MNNRRLFQRFLVSVLLSSLIWMILLPAAKSQTIKEPLSRDDVIKLLKGKVSPERVQGLAKQRGIDFVLTPETETEMRSAGATEALLSTLRDLAPKPASSPPASPTLLIKSDPGGAQVFIDDELIAKTSREGRLRISTLTAGRHKLRISVDGYRDYEETLDLETGKTKEVSAGLQPIRQRANSNQDGTAQARS